MAKGKSTWKYNKLLTGRRNYFAGPQPGSNRMISYPNGLGWHGGGYWTDYWGTPQGKVGMSVFDELSEILGESPFISENDPLVSQYLWEARKEFLPEIPKPSLTNLLTNLPTKFEGELPEINFTKGTKRKSTTTPSNTNWAGIATAAAGGAQAISGMITDINASDVTQRKNQMIANVNNSQMQGPGIGDNWEQLMADWDTWTPINNVTKADMGAYGTGSGIGKAISGTASGAAAGASFGPWGALVGGVVGLGTSLAGLFTKNNKAQKAADAVNNQIAYTNAFNERSLTNRAGNIMTNQINDLQANYAAMGGDLHTKGSIFSTGLTEVNAGDSHESNPYEGVLMGIDPQGVPNLVEEGETIYNDYVFSKRLTVPKDVRNKYKLGGKVSFADASKYLAKESEERPNDPISKRGLEAMMGDLANAQEELKFEQMVKKLKASGMSEEEIMYALASQAQGQQQAEQQPMEQSMGMEGMNDTMGMDAMMGSNMAAFGGRVNKFAGDDPGEPSQMNSRAPYNLADFLRIVQAYTQSKTAGNTKGKYAPGTKMTKEQIKALEASAEYKAFTDYVKANPNDPVVQQYLKALDAGVAKGTMTLFNGEKLRDNWVDLYNSRRTDELEGIYHLNPEGFYYDNTVSTPVEAATAVEQTATNPSIKRWLMPSADPAGTPGLRENSTPITDPWTDDLAKQYKYLDKIIEDDGTINYYYNKAAITPSGKVFIKDNTVENSKWNEDTRPQVDILNDGYRFYQSSNGDTYYIKDKPLDLGRNKLEGLDNIAGWMQAGLGIANAFRPTDYSAAEAMERAASRTPYMPIGFKPVSNYLTYKPLDRDYYFNKAQANYAANRRSLTNTSSGNRGTAQAGLLASDYNLINGMGELVRQGEDYNFNRQKEVATHNLGIDEFNSNGIFNANHANQGAYANAYTQYMSGVEKAATMRNAITQAAIADRDANLEGSLKSIYNMGRNALYDNWTRYGLEHGLFGDGAEVGYYRRKAKGGKLKKKGLTI